MGTSGLGTYSGLSFLCAPAANETRAMRTFLANLSLSLLWGASVIVPYHLGAVMGILWTIGHSNHDGDHLVELLRTTGIVAVVDVRSLPFSQFAPQFNRGNLEGLLARAGMTYRQETDLGGRPSDLGFYDSAGHVLYGTLAESEPFQGALARLEALAMEQPTAIMCGEEDPSECHRRLLIGRVLTRNGWLLRHIRGDGRIDDEARLNEQGVQEGLFEGEHGAWRSTQSVLRRSRPPSSSIR